MLLSNQPAAALSDEFDICGITDVTGFGLAGHMLEMLRASNVSARIELDSLPLLAGVAELVPQGIESTLAPDNRDAEVDIAIDVARRSSAEYVALFDPQTSGGMLMGVRENDVDQILNQLSSQSNVAAAVIGRIEEFDATQPRITIT
jgi:selenide,water dikinase